VRISQHPFHVQLGEATLGRELLTMHHSLAFRTLCSPLFQRLLKSLTMLLMERVQDVFKHHPHHGSLGNQGTLEQPPDTSNEISFYDTRNDFCIGAPVTSWPTAVCHIELNITCFLQTEFQRNECPAICMTEVCSGSKNKN
jgi:hypothetical protein